MVKKVNIGKKPTPKVEDMMDEWVGNGEANSQENQSQPKPKKAKLKRLTLDLDEELHKAIKLKSVEEGKPMADLLRELLQKHFL